MHTSMSRARVQSTPAVIMLAVLSLAACSAPPPPIPPPPAVTVASAITRTTSDFSDFTGRLEGVESVDIRPRVSGYIQRVAFKEGSMVAKGDALFIIDPRQYQDDVARAEAEVARARTHLQLAASETQRAKRLVAVQAISREEYDTRSSSETEGTAQLSAALAALRSAQLNLAWTVVRSPIAGRVGRAEQTAGNLVQGGPPSASPLTTVVSLDPVFVYFDTDEQTYLRYAELARAAHATAHVGLADEQGFPHEATLNFVDNRVDATSGTIRVRAVLPNHDHRFTPGLFARVRLTGGAPYTATLVQDQAVGTDQDRKFVLVLKHDGTVDVRPVQLGPLVDGLRVIKSGLNAGDKVVINGLQRVRPGMKVSPTEQPMMPDSLTAVASARSGHGPAGS